MQQAKPIYELSDEEEAQLQAEILGDPEHPEATDEELAQARPFADVFPDFYESIQREEERRAASRERVSLLLDGDVLEKFRALGEGWEARINQILRASRP